MVPQTQNLEICLTTNFERFRKALLKKSAEGKRVKQQVDAALHNWQVGEDPGLSRTHHGESRVTHLIKYDLKGYFRLVVYEHAGKRIPLFVGSHDDTDHWLNENAGRDFAVDIKTRQLTYSILPTSPVTSLIVDSTTTSVFATGPVFDRVPPGVIASLLLVQSTLDAMRSYVTFDDIDSERVYTLLSALNFPSTLVRDAVLHAYNQIMQGEVEAAVGTLRLATGDAITATESPEVLGEAIASDENSESIVSLSSFSSSELERLLSSHSFTDWMLFLHPGQQRIVQREFNGPARLLGVSGSGKTTVLIHRAVHLAKKYAGERILVLCLNRSLQKLIEHLLNALCPPEQRADIVTATIHDICYRTVKSVAPSSLIESHDHRSGETLAKCWDDFLEKDHARVCVSPIADALRDRADKVNPSAYLLDELIWIRSGFGWDNREEYLTCDRVGRGIALPRYDPTQPTRTSSERGMPVDTRKRLLSLLADYEEYMEAGGLLDPDGVSLQAFSVRNQISEHVELLARCVLVDEVQDCSTVELAVIGQLCTSAIDGLFLVGDPVQKVFPKQHDLSRAGVDIIGRGQLLRHNYRNTRQVLEAAFMLIRHFVADSEISSAEVLEPQFAFRDGSKPMLYECESLLQQIELVASYINLYSSDELESVCVCSAVEDSLVLFEQYCQHSGLKTSRITGKEDIGAGGIKVATFDHVKGFEFEKVFILDLSDGVLPSHGLPFEERWRDAFRIYVAMTRARDELVMCYVYNRSILLGPLQDTVTDAKAAAWLSPPPQKTAGEGTFRTAAGKPDCHSQSQ